MVGSNKKERRGYFDVMSLRKGEQAESETEWDEET